MDTDKIRRPKSEARKKSEARSPKALCQRLGKSHTRSQIAMDKDLGGKAIPSEVVSVTDGHDHGDFGGFLANFGGMAISKRIAGGHSKPRPRVFFVSVRLWRLI